MIKGSAGRGLGRPAGARRRQAVPPPSVPPLPPPLCRRPPSLVAAAVVPGRDSSSSSSHRRRPPPPPLDVRHHTAHEQQHEPQHANGGSNGNGGGSGPRHSPPPPASSSSSARALTRQIGQATSLDDLVDVLASAGLLQPPLGMGYEEQQEEDEQQQQQEASARGGLPRPASSSSLDAIHVAAAVSALARHAPQIPKRSRSPPPAASSSPLARAAAAVAAAARARQRNIAATTLELVAARAPRMQARQLSSSLHAIARLGPWLASLPPLTTATTALAGAATPPSSPLSARHRAIFVDLVRRAGDPERLAEFTPQGLVTVLWSCARLGYRPDDGWVGAWLAASRRRRGDFNSQDLSLAAWALGRLGIKPSGGWAEAFARASEPRLETMRPGELAALAGGFAAMRRPPPAEWWRAATRASRAHLLNSSSSLGAPQMLGHELATLLWAMAVARAPPPDAGWARDFEAAVLAAVPALSPRSAATLLWSLGRLSHGQHWSYWSSSAGEDEEAMMIRHSLPRVLQRRLVEMAEEGAEGAAEEEEDGAAAAFAASGWRGADVSMALMGFARLCAREGLAPAAVAEPRFVERLLTSAPALRALSLPRPEQPPLLGDDNDDGDDLGAFDDGAGSSGTGPGFIAEDLANMAWALGTLCPPAASSAGGGAAAATAASSSSSSPPERWWRAFLDATQRAAAAGELSHAQLGALLWGVARVCGSGPAAPPPPPDLRWWAAVLSALARELPRASPASLSHALWSLASLGVRPNREWMQALLRAHGRLLSRCNALDLAAAGDALRRLRYRPPRAWAEAFARRAREVRPTMGPRQRRAVREAMVAMGLGEEVVAAGWAEEEEAVAGGDGAGRDADGARGRL